MGIYRVRSVASLNDRGRGGFTVIELLVTISIIGILASVTVLALGKAKRRATLTECMSNLRQQGVNLASFVQQYDVYLYYIPPQDLNNPRRTEHRTMWATAIAEGRAEGLFLTGDSVQERGSFRCPGARLPDDLSPGEGFSCYGYNAYGLVGADGAGELGLGGVADSTGSAMRPVRDNEVTRPSEMMAIADGVIGNGNYLNDGLSLFSRTAQPGARPDATGRVKKRHGGMLGVLFCDGHTESVALSSLFHDKAANSLSRWNRDGKAHSERAN